jgi:site-specific recombinase XerD
VTVTTDGLTLSEAARMIRDAVKDRSYEATELGPKVVEYLAWKRLGRAAERTLDQYERDLSRLAIECADKTVEQVDVAELMLVLQQFPAPSWRRVRAAWNGFFRWSVRFGLRPTNPMERLPELRPEPRRVYDIFTPGERAKLVRAQADSLLPERDRLGALLFQELGVRKEEARLLRVESFDLVLRVVVVLGKGDKERTVPFEEIVWTALMEFFHTPIPHVRVRDGRGWAYEDREPRAGDYIFFPSGSTGAYRDRAPALLWTDPTVPMSKTAMHGWWQRSIERAGVRYRSLHMNRHTVGTELVEAEVDAFTVRDWLGHADTRTTEVYVHNARRRLRKAADRLSAARRRWLEEEGDE